MSCGLWSMVNGAGGLSNVRGESCFALPADS
jgi:hypothetical protein